MGTLNSFPRPRIGISIVDELSDFKFTYKDYYSRTALFQTHIIEAWFNEWTMKITRRYKGERPRLMSIEVVDMNGNIFHEWIGDSDDDLLIRVGDIANAIAKNTTSMRLNYWYANAATLYHAINNDAGEGHGDRSAVWYCFQTCKGMVGELCIERLPDNDLHYEVYFYKITPQGKPFSDSRGDMQKLPLSFKHNIGETSVHWNTCYCKTIDGMSFNRFKMIMDNIDVTEYEGHLLNSLDIDGSIHDMYEDEGTTYAVIFKGLPNKNWFDLKMIPY